LLISPYNARIRRFQLCGATVGGRPNANDPATVASGQGPLPDQLFGTSVAATVMPRNVLVAEIFVSVWPDCDDGT